MRIQESGKFRFANGSGQHASQVDLHQDGIGDVFLDAFAQKLDVGHEQVVAH